MILVVGGSLGARSINCMMMDGLGLFPQSQVQVIWQTGRLMQQQAREAVASAHVEQWVKVHPFISRMDMAYAAADLVISRAGAIAISELTLVAKPVILVPSPNVAEDQALALVKDPERCASMKQAISKMAVKQAANLIVDQIEQLIKK